MTELEKMKMGEWYDANHDPKIIKQRYTAFDLCFELNQIKPSDFCQKKEIIQKLLGTLPEGLEIVTPFSCDYGKNIFLGNDVIINMNCTFVDNKPIRIGDRVLIASNVQIYTSSHPVLPQERLVPDFRERRTTFFRTFARPIEIKDNVWIGGGCILLPGVTIGENSVIGAGSVVNRTIPPNCVAVGNPCRVIRQFDNNNTKK